MRFQNGKFSFIESAICEPRSMTGTAQTSHDPELAGHKKIHWETAERGRQALASSLKLEKVEWACGFLGERQNPNVTAL
jgi:hypothetical protein